MTDQKNHYRAVFDSPYLSSQDIVEPTILTISYVRQEDDKTKKTKDKFNTAYFKEKELRPGELLKPMILNATNSRTLKNMANSPFVEDWNNMPVMIYVDSAIRFGRDTVEGLRISTERPRLQKPELQQGTPAWENAIIAYIRDDNFDAIEKRMTVSEVSKSLIIDQAIARKEGSNNVA